MLALSSWDLKKIKWPLAVFFILLIGWLLITQLFFRPVLITVVGEGRVKVKPEIVSFTASVVNSASSAPIALADNNQMVRNIISVVKSAGAKEEEIIVAYPQVVSPNTTLGQVNFQAVNAIGVTLKNVSGFDVLVNQLYANGARSITDVVFTTENAEELEKQAVAEAIKDAKKRAREIGWSLKKLIMRMVSVTTSEMGGAGALAGEAPLSESAEGGISNSPSQIEIVRQASIVFELR